MLVGGNSYYVYSKYYISRFITLKKCIYITLVAYYTGGKLLRW